MNRNLIYSLIIALTAISLSSCNPCSRLARRCPPEIITKDSIIERETITYRDTTIFHQLPGTTVIDSIPIPCPDIPPAGHPAIYPNRLSVAGHLASAHSWIHQGRLFLELNEKDTLLPIKLENALKSVNHWREAYYNREETIHIHPPWYEKAFSYFGMLALVAIAGYILAHLIIRK